MSEKQCPFYQGVCGIDESIVCYCSSVSCDIYRDYVSAVMEKVEDVQNDARQSD